jgi:hypothetical protein
MRAFSLIVLAAVSAATPTLAADRSGYSQIAAGNLSDAEQRIVAERRIFPDRPELMLNLAAVYRNTGRDAQARALYAAVLDRPAVSMDLPSGAVASSHAVAQRALARFSPQMATR